MRIACVMPVKGREEIITHSIKRLSQLGIHVFCAGYDEKEIVEFSGGYFFQVDKNITLGQKWQYCVDRARGINPDALLIMGSSDFISDNWCEVLYKDIEEGIAMSGTAGCYFLDINRKNEKCMFYWDGYLTSNYMKKLEFDTKEPIGIGRLISSKALDLINWNIFDVMRNNSMDYSITRSLSRLHGLWKGEIIRLNPSKELYSISLSTYKYKSMHKMNIPIFAENATIIENPESILEKHFPELLNIWEPNLKEQTRISDKLRNEYLKILFNKK